MKPRDQEGRPLEAILEQLRDGTRREESFRLVFDRFYRPLLRFFEGRGFSTEECQDLIQETFLRVFQGIAEFRGDARWDHWLFRIAHNTALKAVRHRSAAKRAAPVVPLEEVEEAEGADAFGAMEGGDPGGSAAPLRLLLDKERKDLLSRAIDGLPAQMRRCVRLWVFQDLDYEEIAEVLQISPSTVKVQIFKARKRLKVELGDTLTDCGL